MRSRSNVAILLFIILFAMSATVSHAARNEKDVDFWAWTYGDGVPALNSTCPCVVGPCPGVYELVGHYHIDCYGNRTEEWGYTDWNGNCLPYNHPTDRVVTITNNCPY